MVFWHPKGWTVWQEVEQYMRRVYRDNGYQEVKGPADPRQGRCGKDRPLGQVPREHVHDGIGEARLRAQADELPRPHPDLQTGHQELPRPAAALRRVRPVPPQRAHGRPARHHARARLHAGRRPHLLHRGPDPRPRCVAFTALLQKVYADFGFTDIIYKVARPEKSASAPTRAGTRPSTRWRPASSGCPSRILPGEGAFLRPEDRIHAEGRARPPVAVRHDAGRLRCRAPGRRVRGEDGAARPR